MKYSLIALACLLVSQLSISQDNASTPSQPYWGKPSIVIKGEEFMRFPAPDFLSAVNTLYPWIFSGDPNTNRYNFVVDGQTLFDINGISLYDIEEVTFNRLPVDGSLFPYSNTGTFYIRMRKGSGKATVRFNTQYNHSWKKDIRSTASSGTDERYYNAGYLQSNHLSASVGKGKLKVHSSAVFDMEKFPYLKQDLQTASSNQHYKFSQRYNTIKGYLALQYHFSNRLEAGINGNYARDLTKGTMLSDEIVFFPSDTYQTITRMDVKKPLTHYYANAFIKWSPVKNLQNELSYTYLKNDFHFDREQESNYYVNNTPDQYVQIFTDSKPWVRHRLFRNRLSYALNAGKWKIKTQGVFSYLNIKGEYNESRAEYRNGMPATFLNLVVRPEQKVSTLTPLAEIGYNDLFSLYGGWAFVLNADKQGPMDGFSKNPFAGLVLNLKKMARIDNMSRFDLSFHYSDMIRPNGNPFWLPYSHSLQSYFPNTQLGFAYTAGQAIIAKNKTLSVQVNTSFNNERWLIGAEWSRVKFDDDVLVPVSIGTGMFYVPEAGTTTETGFSFYTQAKPISKENKEWKTRLNILIPDAKYEYASGLTPEPGYSALQVGWQNQVRYHRFFAQLNASVETDRPVTGSTGIILNYLLAGYNLRIAPKSILSNASLFIHARNLIADEDSKELYWFHSYAGAGINFSFR